MTAASAATANRVSNTGRCQLRRILITVFPSRGFSQFLTSFGLKNFRAVHPIANALTALPLIAFMLGRAFDLMRLREEARDKSHHAMHRMYRCAGSRLCLPSAHQSDQASDQHHTQENQHRPGDAREHRRPRRWRADVDLDVLFTQLRYQRRVAEVGHSGREGIVLRTVRRPLEASVDLRSSERDACDIAGLELIEKRTIGRRGCFVGCFNLSPDDDEQQHRRYGDEPHRRSLPPWPLTMFHCVCHITILVKGVSGSPVALRARWLRLY